MGMKVRESYFRTVRVAGKPGIGDKREVRVNNAIASLREGLAV